MKSLVGALLAACLVIPVALAPTAQAAKPTPKPVPSAPWFSVNAKSAVSFNSKNQRITPVLHGKPANVGAAKDGTSWRTLATMSLPDLSKQKIASAQLILLRKLQPGENPATMRSDNLRVYAVDRYQAKPTWVKAGKWFPQGGQGVPLPNGSGGEFQVVGFDVTAYLQQLRKSKARTANFGIRVNDEKNRAAFRQLDMPIYLKVMRDATSMKPHVPDSLWLDDWGTNLLPGKNLHYVTANRKEHWVVDLKGRNNVDFFLEFKGKKKIVVKATNKTQYYGYSSALVSLPPGDYTVTAWTALKGSKVASARSKPVKIRAIIDPPAPKVSIKRAENTVTYSFTAAGNATQVCFHELYDGGIWGECVTLNAKRQGAVTRTYYTPGTVTVELNSRNLAYGVSKPVKLTVHIK